MSDPTTVLKGRYGAVYNGAAEVLKCTAWSLSISKDVEELQHLNSDSKEAVEGLIGSTGSVEFNRILNDDTGQNDLLSRFAKISDDGGSTFADIDDTPATLKLYESKRADEAGENDYYWQVEVILSGFEAGASAGNVQAGSCAFTVTGDVSYIKEPYT